MSNLDFVKARMGKRVRMTQIGDSQTNELPNLLCMCYLTLTPCPNCSFRQAPINSAWELLIRFLLHKRYYKKVENPALSLLTQHVSTNTVILYGRKLRLKRLKDSPHSGPQTKAANGKAEMNSPKIHLCRSTACQVWQTVTPWWEVTCPLPPFVVSKFTLGFVMVHFLYQCGLAMGPQDSLDVAMKIFFF